MTNNIKIGLGAFLVILILFFINQRLQSEHSIKPGKIFDGNIDDKFISVENISGQYFFQLKKTNPLFSK